MSDDFDNIPPWLLDDDDDDEDNTDDNDGSAFETAGGFPVEDDGTDIIEDSMLWSQDVASQTGELDPDDSPPETSEGGAVPEWLTGVENADVEMTSSGTTSEGDDVPNWMAAPVDREGASDTVEDADETPALVPGWLDNPDATAEEDAGELPPWLAEEEDNQPQQIAGEFTTDEGTLSEAWLAQADTLADDSNLDMTYDEWIVRQDDAAREVDVEEEVPVDLFLDDGTDTLDPDTLLDAGTTGELPDWYLGLESVDQTGSLVTHDTMDLSDWLEQAKPDEAPPAEAPAVSDEFETPDDLFGDFAADEPAVQNEELPGTGDLFGDFAMDSSDIPGEELPNTGDLFGDFAVEGSDAPGYGDDIPDLDAFLAESPSEGEADLPNTGMLSGDFADEAAPVSPAEDPEFDLDSFLADDAQPVMGLDDGDDDEDLFDAILGAAPAPEEVGAEVGFDFDDGDADLLDSILSSTPAPEESAVSQPAVDFNDDDDFFESILDTSPGPEELEKEDSDFAFSERVPANETDQISADLEALDTDYNFEFDARTDDDMVEEPDLDLIFAEAETTVGDSPMDEPTMDDIFGADWAGDLDDLGDDQLEVLAEQAEAAGYDPEKQAEIEAFLSDIGLVDVDEPDAVSAEDAAEQLSAEDFGFDFGFGDETDDAIFQSEILDLDAYSDEASVPEATDTADLGMTFEEDRDTVEFEDMETGELAPDSMIAEPVEDALPDPEPELPDGLNEDERVDWFAEEEPADVPHDELSGVPRRESTVLDWLSEIEEVDEEELAAILQQAEEDEAARQVAESALPIEVDDVDFDDIDDYIASLDDLHQQDEQAQIAPAEGEFTFDQMMATGTFDIVEDAAEESAIGEGQIESDRPDWLTELGAVVGTVSASAVIRQRKDRDIDDLPERLKRLHQRGENLSEPIDAPDRRRAGAALAEVLPGVDDALMALPITTTATSGLSQALELSKAQQNRLDLLMNMVTYEQQGKPSTRLSAIDQTFSKSDAGLAADPFAGLDESLSAVPEEEASAPAVTKPRRRRYNVVRLLVAILVAIAVIVPFFVAQVRVGDLPPSSFAEGGTESNVYDAVNSLNSGELVLFAVEYNPTAAGELDTLTDAMLQHVLLRGARPVIVSRSPVGLLHANNIINELNADPMFRSRLGGLPLVINRDYYVVRYLVGDIVGLRELAENPASIVQTDISGAFTGLSPATLDDFALTVVIAERPESLRDWAEQIAPQTTTPMVAATSFSAAPVAIPYVQAGQSSGSGIQGLLVGFEDAYTYDQLISTQTSSSSLPPSLVVRPSAAASPPAADDDPLESDTSLESQDPATEAEAEEPETIEPEATGTELSGVVNTNQAVNVRSGPGIEFFAVTVLQPGEQVTVIDVNDAGDWVQIRTTDGSEGWVLGSLITLQVPDAADSMTENPDANESMTEEDLDNQQSSNPAQFVRVASVAPLPIQQDEDSQGDGDEASEPVEDETLTDEAATQDNTEDDATAQDVTEVVEEAPPALIAIADSTSEDIRWYSMTFSTIVIIIIIAFSSVINVLRGMRRRRSSV